MLEPKKVVAYACIFACGHKVTTVKKSMIEHQKRCLKNPELKTCATCSHDKRGYYEEDTGYRELPYCDVDARGDKILIKNCIQHEWKYTK